MKSLKLKIDDEKEIKEKVFKLVKINDLDNLSEFNNIIKELNLNFYWLVILISI